MDQQLLLLRDRHTGREILVEEITCVSDRGHILGDEFTDVPPFEHHAFPADFNTSLAG